MRSWVTPYGVSLAVAAAAVLVREPLRPLLGDHVPFITLFPAIAFIAWYGGRGPALLALVVSSLAVPFFILEPRYSFTIQTFEHQAGFVLFFFISLALIAMFESMRKAWVQATDQKERLRTTLASIGDAVIATDTEGRVTNMNAVAESLTGWLNAEALGQPLESVFHIVNEKTRQPVDNPVQKVLMLGQVVGLANHTVLIAKDGTEKPIDDSAAPIRWKDGQIVGCVLVFRAIAARRLAEIDLRQSEERLRSVVNTVIDGIITIDQYGTVETYNPAAEKLFGFTAPEVIGRNVKMLMPEPYRQGHDGYVADYLRTGRAKIIGIGREVVGRRKDGSTFPMDLAVSEFRLGERRHFTGIVRDITARKQSDELLRQSEERYRSLTQATASIVWITDAEGRFVTPQPAWAEFTGQSWEELRDFGWTHALHADDRQRVRQLWEAACASKTLYRSDGRLWHAASGSYRHFEAGGIPILNADGSVREWVGMCLDVEDRKRAEQALTEADRRKDEFLATLAHELRNPLAPIRNAVQILLVKGPPDPDLKWGREVIDRQVRHMARLLDDLLDVSRITHNKLELRKERIELSAVVHSAIETSRPVIDSGGQELSVDLPSQPLYLDADPVRLAQVFSNLLNNAAKYSEAGSRIRLIGERQGSDVVVSVKDDGVGIAAEMLPRIFDIFSQAKRVLERSQGGLGIGLSLVRGLLELHDGSIEVRSDGPGKGSEFIVRLPVIVEKIVPAAAPPSKDGEPAGVTKCRLLIVDDLKDSADSLAMLMRTIGHEVHTAYDGEDAIIAAEKFMPEVVLLDIGMPKLNGYDACRRIRQQPWSEEMYLIALTGWGQEDDRRRTEEAGFDHHMVKPVDPGELMRVLASLHAEEGSRLSALLPR